MPRMQLYLPEDLYREVKARKLPASELFQAAVRSELRHEELRRAADELIAERIAQLGEPPEEVQAWADAIAAGVAEDYDNANPRPQEPVEQAS